jgi:hypothetical protein
MRAVLDTVRDTQQPVRHHGGFAHTATAGCTADTAVAADFFAFYAQVSWAH